MEAMVVVKAAVMHKLMGLYYERLAFHFFDSVPCLLFLGLGLFGGRLSDSALQDNISRLRTSKWEAINRVLVQWAQREDIDAGRKMRLDSTPVEAGIPPDSSSPNDLVRVICRDLHKADLPKSLRCRDRRRVAKRSACQIVHAKNAKQRKSLYRSQRTLHVA